MNYSELTHGKNVKNVFRVTLVNMYVSIYIILNNFVLFAIHLYLRSQLYSQKLFKMSEASDKMKCHYLLKKVSFLYHKWCEKSSRWINFGLKTNCFGMIQINFVPPRYKMFRQNWIIIKSDTFCLLRPTSSSIFNVYATVTLQSIWLKPCLV